MMMRGKYQCPKCNDTLVMEMGAIGDKVIIRPPVFTYRCPNCLRRYAERTDTTMLPVTEDKPCPECGKHLLVFTHYYAHPDGKAIDYFYNCMGCNHPFIKITEKMGVIKK